MKIKAMVLFALFALSQGVQAQQAGDIVEGYVPVLDARGSQVFSKFPLPPGKWEVLYSGVRQSTGNTAAELRDVRLMQIEDGRLKHAHEITMKVNGVTIPWNDEPCKEEPTLAKNDYGTSLWKQKCLTLHAIPFLQNNNASTQSALASLASRGVNHDFNSLVLRYQRFGDFGYLLTVRYHFFPSLYGSDNPTISVMNESPWHPARIGLDEKRKALTDSIFKYGESIAPLLDDVYLRKEVSSLPGFNSP